MMDIQQATIRHLQQFMPFQKMDREAMRYLVSQISINYFSEGEVILDDKSPLPPTHFYILKQGMVESQREAKDSQFYKNAFEFEEGDSFPLGPLLTQRPNVSQFIALNDCFVYQIPAQAFHHLRDISPEFKSYCETRIASLLEESKRIIQTQYAVTQPDQHPLSQRIDDLLSGTPFACDSQTPVHEVLSVLDKQDIGSMVIVDDHHIPVGIFTLHDVLRRIAMPQAKLDDPIAQHMTPQPVCLSRDAMAYEAAVLMARHGFRHVLITDPSTGRLEGVISEKDLFSAQRVGLRQLSQRIQEAPSIARLREAKDEIKVLTKQMMAQGVAISQLTHIISSLNDAITDRLIQLILPDFPKVQQIPFAWLAMGSEGRIEQMFYTDQDNGIIFADPDDPKLLSEQRHALLAFAKAVNYALDALGFPLCKGQIMAMNPQWCLSFSEWCAKFQRWMNTPDPQALLNSSIFFDFRGIAGQLSLSEQLRHWLQARVHKEKSFLRFMAKNALLNKPPLGFLKDFSTNKNNAIDLKINGAALLVDIARLLALAHQSKATNTEQRFREVVGKTRFTEKQLNGCIETFHFLQLLRMQHHFTLDSQRLPLSNEIDPASLNALNTRVLREAFRLIRELQQSIAHQYRL